jgi:aspartate aminotransferase-like enzyme
MSISSFNCEQFHKLAGKVFRIGHMGSQANINLIKEAMDILETVVHDI